MKTYFVPVVLIVLAITGLLYAYHALDWLAISANKEFPVMV
ncbi:MULTISPECIES: hypothetical protein [Yersinia]|nr:MULTISPECIES: hypothetical protein [Yersinia]MDN0096161.1 hypothetical protein [Yersinia rohdei]